MEPVWIITLFADLTLRRGSDASDVAPVRRFRSRKAASLLAYLAFHRGRAVSREFLCDLLWPEESDIEVARNRLRVILASLRRQFEPPGVPPGAVIENVGNHQIRLRAETVSTDLSAFEDAVRSGDSARAVALYRGPLLPSFYEDWISVEQQRLAAAFERMSATRCDDVELPPSPAAPELVVAPSAPKSVAMPLYLTRFFGRDAERRRLAELFADPQARLVTLTGPGGIGKTRFAAEVVREDPMLRAFVPLSDMWDASQLGGALRQALQLPPTPNADPLSQVVEYLNRETKTRVVLDNVEQIAQGTAVFIGELLTRAPGLFLIVTSRRQLGFPGEREVCIPPLPLPVGDDPHEIASAPSVQLFLNRAQSVRPDYQVTPHNGGDMSALCRLLDGVPLALELAAARAATLNPGQIAARLSERMETNSEEGHVRKDKEGRHHSMNAVIEWSYALMPPDLRRLFLSLSIFRGTWDIAAATSVTGEAHALDGISRLRGHSLVTQDGGRFRLLETLRSWADERLGEGPVRAALVRHHAAHYRKIGEEAAARTAGDGQSDALDTLEAEQANLQAALARALEPGGDTEMALRLALALYPLGRTRGNLSETLTMFDRALAGVGGEIPVDPGLHSRALLAAGELTLVTRGAEAARPLLGSALPLARQSGEPLLIARALRSFADNALLGQDYVAALPPYQEALQLQRNLGDERGAAGTLNSLAILALRSDKNFAEAARLTLESNEYYRRVDDKRMLSYSVFNLGELAMEQGEFEEAEPYFQESFALAHELRDDWQCLCAQFALARTAGKLGRKDVHSALLREVLPKAVEIGDLILLADALAEQAAIAREAGNSRHAVTLLAAAHGIALPSDAASATGFADAAALIRLPVRRFRAAWDRGTALTPEDAVAVALGE